MKTVFKIIITTGNKICSCEKSCKNERGLKIHRTKMGCQPILNLVDLQRKGQPHETEEEMDQETHHSVQNLRVQGEEEDGSNRTIGCGERGMSSGKASWF